MPLFTSTTKNREQKKAAKIDTAQKSNAEKNRESLGILTTKLGSVIRYASELPRTDGKEPSYGAVISNMYDVMQNSTAVVSKYDAEDLDAELEGLIKALKDACKGKHEETAKYAIRFIREGLNMRNDNCSEEFSKEVERLKAMQSLVDTSLARETNLKSISEKQKELEESKPDYDKLYNEAKKLRETSVAARQISNFIVGLSDTNPEIAQTAQVFKSLSLKANQRSALECEMVQLEALAVQQESIVQKLESVVNQKIGLVSEQTMNSIREVMEEEKQARLQINRQINEIDDLITEWNSYINSIVNDPDSQRRMTESLNKADEIFRKNEEYEQEAARIRQEIEQQKQEQEKAAQENEPQLITN